MLERLTQSSLVLQSVVNQANDSLAMIETKLGQQTTIVSDLVDTALTETGASTERMAEQVRTMRDVAQGVLANIDSLTTRLDTQSRDLTESARALDLTNRSLEETLDSRRRSIEDLAVNLVDKTENIDTLMRGFATLISDTLSTAEERARTLGATLATTAETAAANVTTTLEKLNSATGTESERAARQLKAVQEAMIGEMTRAVADTTARFADVTERMREAAQIMQSELEQTRSELRRGVLDMPRETAEQTAGLRKAVAEQVRALTELADIVGKQAATLDISRPVALAAPMAASAAPARAEIARPEPMLRRSEAPAEMPRRPAPPARTLDAPRGLDYEFDRPAPATPPAERAAPPTAPALRDTASNAARDAAGAAGRSGWMADLLRRASREDGPVLPPRSTETPREAQREASRSPQHVVESLNSLSVDIARAIDNDAFLDLWDRYKRGEKNVFTRRLYTMQGQQTFEEMRRKYARDPEFRASVDRYLSDFEGLLDDLRRSDRDGIMVQTYLTSDTGKVYTMLAHAAGRFE
jgi:hypothetical protein